MPVDGGGNVTRPASPIPVTGQGADAPQVNTPIDDIYNILNMLMFLDGRKSLRGNLPMNGYKAANAANGTEPQDYVTLSQMQAAIAEVSLPTGALIPLTGTVVPASWVVANGQSLLRATYPAFWSWVQASGNLSATELGKTVGQYGPGDGSTTFTVPNLYADNGYFIRPISSGRTIGTVQADEIRVHNHNATFSGNPLAPHTHFGALVANGNSGPQLGNGVAFAGPDFVEFASAGTPSGTVSVQSIGGVETRPKNIAYPVLIRV